MNGFNCTALTRWTELCRSSHIASERTHREHRINTSLLLRDATDYVLTHSLHSNGWTRHISYRVNSCIVSCEHCLAMTVCLLPQYLRWANTPQYDLKVWIEFDWPLQSTRRQYRLPYIHKSWQIQKTKSCGWGSGHKWKMAKTWSSRSTRDCCIGV
jgi:hypothetical protein